MTQTVLTIEIPELSDEAAASIQMNSVFFSVRATQMTNKTVELALAL